MANEFKAKNGLILGISHPVQFVSNASSFTQDQSTLLTAYAIGNYVSAQANPLISRINVTDSSLKTLTTRHDITESSLGLLTQTVSILDISVNTLKNRHNITESSLGTLTTKVNIIDASLYNLKIVHDASIVSLRATKFNDASILGYVPYTGATSDISLNTHKITLEAIQFNTTPSTIFKEGLLYFDAINQTLAVNLDTDVTLQVGQENHVLSYNDTSTTIPNGKVVYITGVYNNLQPTIALALANSGTTSKVIGITTHNIPPSTIGYVTNLGVVHDMSTNLWANGTKVYLSETVPGALTSIPPVSPNVTTLVGTVMNSSATIGSVLVDIQTGQSLSDLSDVTIASPFIDQVMKFNGVSWINGPSTTSSAGNGISFYLSDVSIKISGPNNNNPVYTLTHYPYDSSTEIDSTIVNASTGFVDAYLNNALGGTQIDAGQWTFSTYCAVDDTTNTSELIHSIRRVRNDASIRITTSGTSTVRTAIASSGTPFNISDINTGGTIDTDTYIETSTGLFRVLSRASDTQVTILCPTTYTNETSSSLGVWKELFQSTTGDIETTSISLIETNVVKPAYSIVPSDKLADILFAKTNRTSNTTISYAHHGTSQATRFLTPLIIRHNDLSGIQGGLADQRNHISNAELAVLQATSGINTGNQDLSAYALSVNVNSSTNALSIRLNTTDTSLNTLKNRYNITETSVGTLTTRYNTTETSVGSIYTAFIDTDAISGFIDGNNIIPTYNWTNRTITLTGNLTYYFQGVKKTLTSPWTSSAHTATPGAWYLYSTDGTNFTWSQTPWSFSNIMGGFVNYDVSSNLSFSIKETHGIMDWKSHEEFHTTVGTYRKSGLILTAGTYTINTATDVATTPGFDVGIAKDEDVETTIPVWPEGTYTTMYIGASNIPQYNFANAFPFVSTGSYLQVNNATTGTMTNGINSRWYNVYQLIVPAASDVQSQKYRMIMLQPQATFTSLAAAQSEDPRTLSLGTMAGISEYFYYARITYVTSVGDNNTGKCRISTNGVSYLLGSKAGQISVSGFSGNDHSSLSNLTWNTSGHIGTGGYETLAAFNSSGVAIETSAYLPYTGGYTNVNIGNNNLTVDTSTFFVDSVNNRVGINSLTPTSSLDVYGTYSKSGVALFLDPLRTGFAGASGTVFTGNGTGTTPDWKTLAAAGIAPLTGGTNYIQNQFASAQNASMWISGHSRVDGGKSLIVSNTVLSILKLHNSTNAVGSTTGFDIQKSSNDAYLWNYDNGTLYLGTNGATALTILSGGAATFASTIQATTAKLTNLTNGYFPYHSSDSDGLVDTPLFYNGVGAVQLLGLPSQNGVAIEAKNYSGSSVSYIGMYQFGPTNPGVTAWTNSSVLESVPNASDNGNFFIDAYRGNMQFQLARVTKLTLDGTGLTAVGTLQGTTAKLTNLTDGYIPYHVSDATGLANSLIFTNGTNIGISATSPAAPLQIGNGTFNGTLLYRGLILSGGWTNTNVRQQNLISFRATDSINADPFGDNIGGEAPKNWHIGLVSDSAYNAASRFSIVNNAIERLVVNSSGYVGIDTSLPQTKLHINTTPTNNLPAEAIRIQNPGTGADTGAAITFYHSTTAGTKNARIRGAGQGTNAGDLYLEYANGIDFSTGMKIAYNGIVSIPNAIASTSVLTGSLVVGGGAGFNGTISAVNAKITSGAVLNYLAVSDAAGNVTWTNPATYFNTATNTPNLQEVLASGATSDNNDISLTKKLARIILGTQGADGDVHVGSSGTGTVVGGLQDYGFYIAHNAYRAADGFWYHSRQATIGAVRFTGGGSGGSSGTTGFRWDYYGNASTNAIPWTNLMTLNTSGYLGVRVDNATYPLDVNGGGNNIIANLTSTDAGSYIQFKDNDVSGWYLGTNTGRLSVYTTGDSEKLSILQNGNIGINIIAPTEKLHVIGNVLVDGNTGNANITINDIATRNAIVKFNSAGVTQWSIGRGDSDELAANSFFIGTGASGGSTAKVVVDSSGNVGIGTAIPFRNLVVYSASDQPHIQLASATSGTSSTDGFQLRTLNNNAYITNFENTKLYIGTNGASQLVVDNIGRFGIGVADPSFYLDIQGSQASARIRSTTGTNAAVLYINNTGGDFYVGRNDSVGTGLVTTGGVAYAGTLNAQGTYPLQFATNSDVAMTILNGGNVGIGTTSPLSKFDVAQGQGFSFLSGADNGAITRTNATAKSTKWGLPHYLNAEEPAAILLAESTSTDNILKFGGGTVYGNTATKISFYTAPNNTTLTGTERVTIDSSGRVGIGTTSPSKKLEIFGASEETGLRLNQSGYSSWDMYNVGAIGDLRFANGSGDKFTIQNSTGYVGVGNIAPNAPLEITGSGSAANNALLVTTDTFSWLTAGSILRFGHGATSGNTYAVIDNLNNGGTAVGNLILNQTGGNVGIGTTAPAAALQVNGVNLRSDTAGTSQLIRIGDIAAAQLFGIRMSNTGSQDLAFDRYYGGVWSQSMMIQRSTGNISIGTIDPAAKLDIFKTTGVPATLNISDAGIAVRDDSPMVAGVGGTILLTAKYNATSYLSGSPFIRAYKENATSDDYLFGLKFGTRGTVSQQTSMTITGNGNVGIGTIDPSLAKLEVIGTGYFSDQLTTIAVKSTGRIYSTGITTYGDLASTTGSTLISFDPAAQIGYLGSRNYSTSSDKPLVISSSLTTINATTIIAALASTNARMTSTSSTGQLTPITDGTANQVLSTNGAGVYSFVTNAAVSATPLNTPSTVVSRDASGNFAAGDITVKAIIITDSNGVPKFKMSYDTATDSLITTKL